MFKESLVLCLSAFVSSSSSDEKSGVTEGG